MNSIIKNHGKKIGLVVILLFMTTIAYAWPQQEELSDLEALVSMVETSGADFTSGEVQFYAVLENRFAPMEELEATLIDVASVLEITAENIEKGSGETYRVVDVEGETKSGFHTHIVVQSNPGDDNTMPPQIYLLVVSRESSLQRLINAVETLQETLPGYAPNGQLSYYLTGEVEGKKEHDERVQMAQTSLQAVRAEIVEGIETDKLVSYTAYTPMVKRHLTVEGQRLNLNIAIHYDDFFDKTVVWAGFPLIHDPY